jgi:ATP-binding cassette subfamily B protein/subfamily B ATP-binding cassette protein MsbA
MVENVKVVSDAPGKLEFPKQWNKIRFNNVSFKFGEQFALREIDFEVHKGQKIAFVGASGSGKTTIINLLERFFEPFSGEILLDNQNFNQFSLESLRQNISLVSQDSFLFNDTVENNIHFGDLKQSVNKVPAAAQAAFAEDFILKTPLQYKTLVGDRGGLFSGGEKQRLSIARAFFKDSAILILDEATSALDSQSEAEVQKGLERLMQGRTVFVVAHRLATVLDADLIFVLDQGSIVARGRHSELLSNSPLYQKLFRMQQG